MYVLIYFYLCFWVVEYIHSFKSTTLRRKQSLWSYPRTGGETCPIYHTGTNPCLEQLPKLYWDRVKCCPVWSVLMGQLRKFQTEEGHLFWQAAQWFYLQCISRLWKSSSLACTTLTSLELSLISLTLFYSLPTPKKKAGCIKSNQLCQGFGQWYTTSFPVLNFYSCSLWHLTWLQMKLTKLSETSLTYFNRPCMSSCKSSFVFCF